MHLTSLDEAIKHAKTFSVDTAVISLPGCFVVVRLNDVATIPRTFKHVATVRAVVSHEVTKHA